MIKIHHPDTFIDAEDTDNNIYIINFSKLLEINIQFALITDIKKYLCDKKLDSLAKSLFYHHICLGLCEYILKLTSCQGHKTIIYYNSEDIKNLHFNEIYDSTQVEKLITKILKEIKKNLPIRVYSSDYSFYYFLSASTGKKLEILASIRSLSEDTFEKYTFDKALKFAEKRNLIFLNSDYFLRLKTKQLMFS